MMAFCCLPRRRSDGAFSFSFCKFFALKYAQLNAGSIPPTWCYFCFDFVILGAVTHKIYRIFLRARLFTITLLLSITIFATIKTELTSLYENQPS